MSQLLAFHISTHTVFGAPWCNDKGAVIRYLVCGCVGGVGVGGHFYKDDGKLYVFHLRIGCISTMLCGHVFISPIFPTQIYIFF